MALTIVPAVLMPTAFVLNPAGVLFVVGSGNGAVVKKGSFANTTTVPITLSLFRVASGGSVAAANTLTPAVTLLPNDVYVPSELINLVLNLGDALWGQASTTGVITGTLSGFTY